MANTVVEVVLEVIDTRKLSIAHTNVVLLLICTQNTLEVCHCVHRFALFNTIT